MWGLFAVVDENLKKHIKMKRILLVISALVMAVSCYDDTVVLEQLAKHDKEIAALQSQCDKLNTSVSSLQQLLENMGDNEEVVSAEPIIEDGKEVGYTLKFTNGSSINIYHGKDGQNAQPDMPGNEGSTPVIGVRKDTDGVYYWTLNGEWLYDAQDEKVAAQGTAGKDGVTPKLKIEENRWSVSYDNGETWEDLGVAGAVTETVTSCLFESVDVSDGFVFVVLADGTSIKLPMVEDGVRSYYLDEIAKTKATLRELMTEPCLVFPLITDVHYLATTSMRPSLIDVTINNMMEIGKDVRFDCVVCMGDLTQGNKAMDETRKEVEHVYDQFMKLGVPYYPCIGNHDTNIYYKVGDAYMKDHVFTLGQMYGLYIRDINNVSYDMASSGTNYYKDFYEFNTRFIFLNSNEGDDYGYSDETLAWFTYAMDTDLDTYVFSHRKASATSSNNNEPAMAEVIKNSKNFKMLFYGHVHYDCEFAAPFKFESTPYLAFAQNANKCYNHELTNEEAIAAGGVIPKRTVETADEDCFDVVVIRPYSQKVNLVRFGAGVDREFNLKTNRSVGESVSSTLPDEVSLELDFSAGWPFAEPIVAKENQLYSGEVYTYTYTYDYEGVERYWDVDFVISRDKIDGFEYAYEDGCLSYKANDLSNSGNSYGMMAIPYISGRYLKSITITNGSTSQKRYTVRKGFNTTPGAKDYTAAVKAAAGTSYTYNFPLTASDDKTIISPGLGSQSSGLRDYAVRMRDANSKVSKIVFTYSKTKPE